VEEIIVGQGVGGVLRQEVAAIVREEVCGLLGRQGEKGCGDPQAGGRGREGVQGIVRARHIKKTLP
jgi:hypothetical protein